MNVIGFLAILAMVVSVFVGAGTFFILGYAFGRKDEQDRRPDPAPRTYPPASKGHYSNIPPADPNRVQ